jgi:hypothetical protein
MTATDDERAAAPLARRGLAPFAQIAARVTAPVIKKHGLAQARVLTEWAAIVGRTYAERSLPERLLRDRNREGVLRLRVPGVWALEFQHLAPLIIERVNAYLGYAAVSRLVLVQGPLPARRPPPKPRPLPELSDDRHLAALAAIGDEDLRERLTRLGRAILQRAGSKPV